jgi:SAM-dependent methyltransferase
MFEPAVVDSTVSFLAELVGAGRALELGIGTGRIALPLSRRGVHVHGIDLSPAMVAQLQAKPGAEAIDVTIGDFATVTVNNTFTLAYLVYNTIENIAAQGLVSHHYWVGGDKLGVFSQPFRYVWPSELDPMARLAGMTLRERWGGWNREPFTSDSTARVSVWEKTA